MDVVAGGDGVNQLVKFASTTAVVSAADPALRGEALTFTATVTSLATGTETFFAGANPISGPLLLVDGSAQFTIATLAIGTHMITARYSGDEEFEPSDSAALDQEIHPFLVSGPGAGPPTVRVFDALTQAERFAFDAYPADIAGGVRVAVGDVTSDGIPDIIAAPGPGTAQPVKVFSLDGSLIASFFPFGATFAGGAFVAVGHFDADAAAEIDLWPSTRWNGTQDGEDDARGPR